MKIENFDIKKDILIVAEIGNNHEGSYGLAEEMIGLAAETGVGAVKFQTFNTDYYVNRSDKNRFRQLKSFELSYDQFEALSKVAKKNGLIFLSTPFDIESAKFLNTIVPAFKIASGDNNFYPLLEVIAKFAKPVIMSSGLTHLDGISKSKAFIEEVWKSLNINQDICVLHCVSAYPVHPEEVNLAAISYLKEHLKCNIGYSDHTIGIEASVLSAALGARIIEKHFTINKNHSDFRDHQLSADPQEMTMIVNNVQRVIKLIGKREKTVQPCEKFIDRIVRRSIVANNDYPAGTIIDWDKITWIRPANGLAPGKENLIIDKMLTKSVTMGEPITEETLEQ